MDISKNILNNMLNLVNDTYASSKDDRHKLHKIEWSGETDTPSILGESEIRADAIVGIVRKHVRIDTTNKDEDLKILKRYGIYKSPILRNWLLDEGDNFKDFTAYLNMLELMRLTLIEVMYNVPDCDEMKA